MRPLHLHAKSLICTVLKDLHPVDLEGHLSLGDGGAIAVASLAGGQPGPDSETGTGGGLPADAAGSSSAGGGGEGTGASSGASGTSPAEFQLKRHSNTDGSWSLHLYLYEGSYTLDLAGFDKSTYPITWSTPYGDFQASPGEAPVQATVTPRDSGRSMKVNVTEGTLAYAPRKGETLTLAKGSEHDFAAKGAEELQVALGSHKASASGTGSRSEAGPGASPGPGTGSDAAVNEGASSRTAAETDAANPESGHASRDTQGNPKSPGLLVLARTDVRRWKGTGELRKAYAEHWLPRQEPTGPSEE